MTMQTSTALDELEKASFLHREWEVDGVPLEKAKEIVSRLEQCITELRDENERLRKG
jgi:hypothetical protein